MDGSSGCEEIGGGYDTWSPVMHADEGYFFLSSVFIFFSLFFGSVFPSLLLFSFSNGSNMSGYVMYFKSVTFFQLTGLIKNIR
jgi:hypothetical protein